LALFGFLVSADDVAEGFPAREAFLPNQGRLIDDVEPVRVVQLVEGHLLDVALGDLDEVGL
jgi:hypothetical protein